MRKPALHVVKYGQYEIEFNMDFFCQDILDAWLEWCMSMPLDLNKVEVL